MGTPHLEYCFERTSQSILIEQLKIVVLKHFTHDEDTVQYVSHNTMGTSPSF